MYNNTHFQFSNIVTEKLRYYVYLLIDPRSDKIFYVGKGSGNRIFDHVNMALETERESDKFTTIRDIQQLGLEVKYYIVRHGLDEEDAYTVESVLIDILTFSDFSSIAQISNIVAGHHQWDKGIKTVDEIEILYACKKLQTEHIAHNLMTININKTYGNTKGEISLYEATRKYWVASIQTAVKVDYVLSEYHGIVRGIFKPEKWKKEGKRIWFEGNEVTDPEITSLYLNKSFPAKAQGMANPIRYFWKK